MGVPGVPGKVQSRAITRLAGRWDRVTVNAGESLSEIAETLRNDGVVLDLRPGLSQYRAQYPPPGVGDDEESDATGQNSPWTPE